jgi:hypothetical protein
MKILKEKEMLQREIPTAWAQVEATEALSVRTILEWGHE